MNQQRAGVYHWTVVSYTSWNQRESGTMSSGASSDHKQLQNHCAVTHTVPNKQQCRCARCRFHNSVSLVISNTVGMTDVYVLSVVS